MMLKRITPLVLLAALALSVPVVSAQSDFSEAVRLYLQGNHAESISLFTRLSKTDAKNSQIWNYLGLNYMKVGESKKAKDAFKKAVKYTPDSILYRGNLALFYISRSELDDAEDELKEILTLTPDDANSYYFRGTARLNNYEREKALEDAEQALLLEPKLAAAAFLKMDAILTILVSKSKESPDKGEVQKMITSARRSLEGCLAVCPDFSKEEVRSRLESLGAFERYLMRRAGSELPEVGTPHSARSELKILTRPRPGYTDSARSRGLSGTVILLVEFKSDGTIGYVAVLQALRYGLTGRALRSAKQITFEPQKIDGKPQTVLRTVHYNFTVY